MIGLAFRVAGLILSLGSLFVVGCVLCGSAITAREDRKTAARRAAEVRLARSREVPTSLDGWHTIIDARNPQ